MREIKEKLYYIVHINYSVDTAYIFSYRKTRVFTTNQAWAFIEDINNASKIEGHLVINSRSIREVKDYLEKGYLANCNFDNTKTIFLVTDVLFDERGNYITKYTASEKKHEEELKFLLDESLQFGEAPEEINDLAAIQQEESDKFIYEDKESNIENFVGFEERLKFFGKMTREYLLKLINQYFPNCEIHLKRYGRVEVTTAFGTFFTLVPKKYEGNDIPDYEYEISFAIF